MSKSGSDGRAERGPRWLPAGLPVAGLHLAALTSLAIARQYFEPLAKGADFFITHGATSLDVVLFALVLVVLPPVVLLLVEWLVGIVSTRARGLLHLGFVGGLIALIVWQAIIEGGTSLAARTVIALSLLAGAAASVAYWRLAVVRSWLTVLSPVPIVVLALFLVFSPVRALVFGGHGDQPVNVSASGAPVVWVMLDELPIASLMDRGERIDAERYPAFAALGRDSTWYRNTATVADFTQIAVPTELTGRTVKGDELQIAAEHPDSLFTLLGKSYHLDVTEFATRICDEAACPVQLKEPRKFRMRGMFAGAFRSIPVFPSWIRGRLADAVAPSPHSPTWLHARPRRSVERLVVPGKLATFGVFLAALRPSGGKTVNYVHLAFPHRPFSFLPTGQYYLSTRRYKEDDYHVLSRDPVAATIDQQRHLAQLALTDRLLGRVLDRLKRLGLYDRALLVVTADHGAAFKPGVDQRIVREANAEEIAFVPFFVKLPGEQRGRIVDDRVQTNDVLPTVAAALGIRVPWKTEGRVAATVGRTRRSLTIYRKTGGGQVTVSRSALERGRRAALRRRLARLGSGPRSIYGLGPHHWLVGRRIADLRVLPRRAVSATVDAPERFRSVDPRAPLLPADIGGAVHGGPAHSRKIAVALNGRVAATGWTLVRGGTEFYTALVPPSAFRRGPNRVEVFEVSGGARRLRLTPLTRAT